MTYGQLIAQAYPDLKINHVHHAGSSSGVVDGAGALLLASPAYAAAHGLKPRARVVASVPEAELSRYVLDLRSITGGQAELTITPDRYTKAPNSVKA